MAVVLFPSLYYMPCIYYMRVFTKVYIFLGGTQENSPERHEICKYTFWGSSLRQLPGKSPVLVYLFWRVLVRSGSSREGNCCLRGYFPEKYPPEAAPERYLLQYLPQLGYSHVYVFQRELSQRELSGKIPGSYSSGVLPPEAAPWEV